ncbi:PC4 and SFRS1-interacting protein, partial [Homalodisca vitripennis]
MNNGNTSKYKIGDRVFAKIKGFSHWPVIIDAIDNESRICKYNVTFYGTNEIGLAVKEMDICPFLENKSKYGSSKAKYFSKAMKEAEKSLNNSQAKLSDSALTERITHTPLKAVPEATSTPLQTDHVNRNQPNKVVTNNQSNIRISFKDAAVNTTRELDPDFQLHAMTEKCISLEEALMKLENKTNSDYHTQILKQQLNKFKTENLNLLGVIETLETDKKMLEEKITKLESSHQKCLNCYPPLKNCLMDSTSHSSKDSSRKLNTFEIPCKNRLNELISDRNDEENSQGGLITTNYKFLNTNFSKKNNNKPKHQTKAVRTDREFNYSSKLIILADSHGKQLGHIIEQKTSVDVCSFIRPGAHFDGVTEELKQHTKNLTNKDHLLIIAGTNNMQGSGTERLTNDINNVLETSQHMNLILGTIPMRYDR